MGEIQSESIGSIMEESEEYKARDGDLQHTCRSCLLSTDRVLSIFGMFGMINGKNVEEQIWEVAEVRMSPDDGFPQGLCPQCVSDLSVAYSFRTRCRRSDDMLRQHSNKTESIKVELDVKSVKSEPEVHSDHAEEKISNISNDNLPIEYDTEKLKCKCKICGRSLSTEESLRRHIARVHNPGEKLKKKGAPRIFNCAECPYFCKRSQGMVYHMRTHTGEKPYPCRLCDSRFTQHGALKNHQKVHSEVMYFTCNECGKQFKYRSSFESHRLVHTKENNFVCDICNKRLRSKNALIGHLNRHYNIKNHSCETCGWAFHTRAELVNHSKMHIREKKYACNICSFKSHKKPSLVQHLMRHSGNKTFQCDSCEMACYTKRELVKHMRKHTKEKNFSCPVCASKFTLHNSIYRHMVRVHGMKYLKS